MATVLRLLMLLACGPLLAPPGACVCRAQVVASPESPAPCCDHDHDDEGEPEPPAAPHCPGCPAAVDADAATLVEPAFTLPPLAPPDAGRTTDDFCVGPASLTQVRPAILWPTSPPLYLAHCSLVV